MDLKIQEGQLPSPWMADFKEKLPHRASWLEDFELLQANLGVEIIDRHTLADQWHIFLNKSQWDKQVKSYAMFDFSDDAPGFF